MLHLAWWCKAGVVERQGLSLGGEEVRGGRVQPTCRKASGPGGRPVRLGHGVGQRGCGTVCVCPGHLAGGPVGRRAPARCSVRECIRVAPGWCVVWGPVVLAGPEAGREQTLPGRKLVAWAMRDSRCLTWLSVIWVAMTPSVKGSVCAGAFETLTQLCEGPRRGGGGRGRGCMQSSKLCPCQTTGGSPGAPESGRGRGRGLEPIAGGWTARGFLPY